MLADEILMGHHRSRRVGQAVEFADYQEYVPGMDLRAMDWKVWGRSDRLVVRRYEAETELPCVVVLDLSGDLATGGGAPDGLPDLERSKAGYAITLAATLLYWFHRQGEPVGLHVMAGEGLSYRDFPARGGRSHLQRLLLELAQARPAGRAALSEALVAVGSRLRRRGWVGVITDGMEEPGVWTPALGTFARRGTDLRFLHVFDREELRLDLASAALFYSPEGGGDVPIDPHGTAEAFAQVVAEYLEEVRSAVVRVGGQYVQVPTDAPLELVFHAVVRGTTARLVLP